MALAGGQSENAVSARAFGQLTSVRAFVELTSAGVSGNSRSCPFPRMKASDSLSRIMGMGFFHFLPVPEFWEWIFSIPFPFLNCGNGFF